MNKKVIILLLLIVVTVITRFYQLGEVPAGFHADAASQAYNAFSILTTGKDRYGEIAPILFRSFGSYQPPIYTYLTIIPIFFFGNTVFAAHFISALSGSLLVLLTFAFSYLLFEKVKQRFTFAGISTFIIAISPWAVFFSRQVVEANLAVTFFVASILCFLLSFKKPTFFLIGCFLIGLSTHAYYSERVISIIFLVLFLILFIKKFIPYKKIVFWGVLVFFIIQIPHIFILNSGAFARRFDQVSYVRNEFSENSSNNSKIKLIFGIPKIFLDNYLAYYSPKNLFFDSDSELGRTMPGLSVFYTWFLIPLIFGLRFLFQNRSSDVVKVIFMLLIITPIPAGLTGDLFYPLRTLDFFWVISLVIGIGVYQLYLIFKSSFLKKIGLVIALYLLSSLFVSYFILFKYEKSESYNYAYIRLMDKLDQYQDKHIVIDSARDPGIAIRIAYLKKYPPQKIQNQLISQLTGPYYSGTVSINEIYTIDNLEIKPLNWGDSCRRNLLMVGDQLSISEANELEHKLTKKFEIRDLSGKVNLTGYLTNPEIKCEEKNIFD